MERTTTTRGHAALGGVLAGLIGGVVISVFMLAASLATAQDIWAGMKMAGAPFLGERAMQPGFDLGAVTVGVVSHFAVSAVWGLLFGVFFFGLSKGWTVLTGAVWGVVVWFGMFYIVLPLVGLQEMARAAPVAMAVAEHILFGLAVAIGFLPFQRRRYIASPARRIPVM